MTLTKRTTDLCGKHHVFTATVETAPGEVVTFRTVDGCPCLGSNPFHARTDNPAAEALRRIGVLRSAGYTEAAV